MSRAVLIWRRLGSPEALRKVVRDMPNWRAFRVIMRAKFFSLLASASATTVAASFADLVTMAAMTSRTRIFLPRFRPSFDGARLAASLETVSSRSSRNLFDFKASNTR